MLGEVDVGDPVDGVDLPVEVLHGGDGVRVGDLGRGVDPEAAGDRGRPGAALDALDAVHEQRRPRLVHRQARAPVPAAAIAAAAAVVVIVGAGAAEAAAPRLAAAHRR